MIGEILLAIFGLLTAVVVWQQLKTRNDGKLIDHKHELALKLVESEDQKFKAQFELLTHKVKDFETTVGEVAKKIESAQKEIQETNHKWAEVLKKLDGFTTKLKVESELTDSKIRKAEDLAMAADQKADQYRTEIIEIAGKHGLVIVRDKKGNSGPKDS